MLRTIFLPAAIFQSVIVGGAYGTGREVVEYISAFGARGGLLVIGLVAFAFAVLLAISFEFARCCRAANYRDFLRALLGRAWLAYELLFVALLIVVLAITASAAGHVLADASGLPIAFGVCVLLAGVVVLNYWGRRAVQATLGVGAAVTCTGIVVYTFAVTAHDGEAILKALSISTIEPGWWLSGVKFAVYNSALIPVIIYCAAELPDRKSALQAGLVAGLLAVMPALCFHLSFLSGLPAILSEALPTYRTIERFELFAALPIYVGLLFATIIQTAVGVLHGVNERLDAWSKEVRGQALTRTVHAAVAGSTVLLSLALSKLGLVTLIAKAYGTLAWGFFVVFTLPLLTIGVRRILRSEAAPGRSIAA